LPEYKRRREAVQQEADQARSRLAELDEPQVPTPATITAFEDAWPTLSVDARRDVAGALLATIRIHADKTVELIPRWGAPLVIAFVKRNAVPVLPEPA
jgi:hypothetical protein